LAVALIFREAHVDLVIQSIQALSLFAQDAPKGPEGGSALTTLIPFVAIAVLFYFVLIRPQKREQSRRQVMLNSVQKNDRVVTIGGIYGVVANVQREADEVTLKVDESTNTKLRITLSSIARVLSEENAEDTSNKQ
jgi:preprotein translocase subunit YajC